MTLIDLVPLTSVASATPIGCSLCRRRAELGYLCTPHAAQLAEMLNPRQRGQIFATPGERRVPPSIPVLYGMLSTSRGVHGPMAVGSSAFGPRSPADDSALVLRDPRSRAAISGPDDRERQPDAPLAVLTKWAHRVTNERGAPELGLLYTVPALSSWLYGATDWIAHQDWCTEAYAALQGVHRGLRVVVGDPMPGSIGRCWVLVDDDGQPDEQGRWRCDTRLYMPEQPPRAPDEPIQLPAVRCGGCGWRYTGAELVQLGRELEAEAG